MKTLFEKIARWLWVRDYEKSDRQHWKDGKWHK